MLKFLSNGQLLTFMYRNIKLTENFKRFSLRQRLTYNAYSGMINR